MAIDAGASYSGENSDPQTDLRWMRAALALARRGLGNVWPNPAVGCVIVNEGRVVGRGWTQPGGRPHAETEALRRAGSWRAAPPPMSVSNRAAIGDGRRPAPTR